MNVQSSLIMTWIEIRSKCSGQEFSKGISLTTCVSQTTKKDFRITLELSPNSAVDFHLQLLDVRDY